MSATVETITARKAKTLRVRENNYRQWAKQYIKPNGWTVISKEEQATCPRNARISNEERGKLEQFEVRRDLPETLFVYVKPKPCGSASYSSGIVATVWTGDVLGYGTWGTEYRSGFGDKRRSVWIRINGQDYTGTAYVSAGDYARLRKSKAKRAKS